MLVHTGWMINIIRLERKEVKKKMKEFEFWESTITVYIAENTHFKTFVIIVNGI